LKRFKKFGIEDKYIGNSHDTSFEKQFMKVTKGKGIDIVLNSLTEDKLQVIYLKEAKIGQFLIYFSLLGISSMSRGQRSVLRDRQI